MILCDAGPLIALLNRLDPAHQRCVRIASSLPPQPFLTTIACFVEAVYFLSKSGTSASLRPLWQMWELGKLRIHCPTNEELARVRELLEQYQDVPMDFADATIVALAESTGLRNLFTLDSDFYIYRINGTEQFQIFMPPPED